MKILEPGGVQARFADLVWENEPLSSAELVRLCEKELNWKKSTTYTVLRRLCEKGLFRNEDGVVTSRLSRDEFYSSRTEQFVEETFHGSLPAFIAAFVSRKSLSEEDANAIRAMIDTYRKEG